MASQADAVIRLRDLQKQKAYVEALDGARALLQATPGNRDLRLIEASSLRHLGRLDEALATLAELERKHPRFSLLHEERGLCHVARKDASNAIQALLAAVTLNPALPHSWRMLVGIYRLTGDAQNGAMAADHLATLNHLPPEVVSATSLFSDGELDRAEPIIRAFLVQHGNHPDAMRLLARIGIAREVYDDAELLLEGVLTLAPDYDAARFNYAQVLMLRHKYAQAQEEIGRLLKGDPGSKEYRRLAASIAVGLGQHGSAIAVYRDLLAETPGVPDVNLWLGHALKTTGRFDDAVIAYRTAATARPDFGDAYWSLANLKTFRFETSEIERMRAEEASSSTAAIDRYHLCFALGKALEDRGETAESWAYYERGNALKRAESAYRAEVIEGNTLRQIEVCSRAFFTERAGWGCQRPDPVFIVGLPRAGSTLLEQILASHSLVEGTHELSDVQNAVTVLQGRGAGLDSPLYPAVLADLPAQAFSDMGEKYLADTQVYRREKPFFIDKMPNNFRHIGLIHLMLPNARIIDARREPMSCCFSNLKQLFANGQEFTYSVDDIARYYRTYLDLMEHWDRVLPGRVLRVYHEDVVDDLEGSVRRMLDFCGLPFEPTCVDFHKTERAVRTPSSEQVRQPIFRHGLDQWKNYEPWLAPLKGALGDALVRYRA
ncbi:MAG: sulfotransferase [Alphaproteobacteria bacterium]|nr:sulfotransferase [Alphaproteobacteria bacterium]MBL6937025.1 sulfotransferase [Alphaproteobacteria bacterium]MBL7097794.1 sulfotransferase [Alphaproteobacteria bacterium]